MQLLAQLFQPVVEMMFKLYDGNSRKYSLWLSNRLFNRSEQVGEKDTSVIHVFVWSEFMFFLLTPLFFVIFLIIVLRAISKGYIASTGLEAPCSPGTKRQ